MPILGDLIWTGEGTSGSKSPFAVDLQVHAIAAVADEAQPAERESAKNLFDWASDKGSKGLKPNTFIAQ
jgi:hypothetical protein